MNPQNGISVKIGDSASGDQLIPHGLGVTPNMVNINMFSKNDDLGFIGTSNGNYNGTTLVSVSINNYYINALNGANGNFQIGSESDNQIATISFDDTNIILSWIKTGTGTSDISVVWWAI